MFYKTKFTGGITMKKNLLSAVSLFFSLFLLYGCAALVVGGTAVGAGVGTYYYVSGELKTDYPASFDQVWNACEKTVADMRGIDVEPFREIARGRINAIIKGEKVKIEVTYKAKELTNVSIRVGLLGNKLSSQLLHDKIADHLANQ